MDSLICMFVMLPKKLIETFDIKELNFMFNKLLNALQKFKGIIPNVNWKEIFFAHLLWLNNFWKYIALELKKFIFIEVVKNCCQVLILIKCIEWKKNISNVFAKRTLESLKV